MSRVGTIERRSPLPEGLYWVDVFGLNIPKAEAWFSAFKDLGVKVAATQSFPNTTVDSTRNWYLFSYKPTMSVPVVWDSSLGFPTVADASIKSSEDTVSRPDLPLDPLDELSNWVNSVEARVGGSLGSIATIVPFAMFGGAVFGGYYLLRELGLLKGKKNAKRKR